MANRFWVGGTGTWDGSSTAHWSTTTGGGTGASVPGTSDVAVFDSNSGTGTVTIAAATNPSVAGVSCSSANITLSLGSNTITCNNPTFSCWIFTAGSVTAGTSTIVCSGTSTTFAGGGATYNNVSFTGGGTSTITEANTFNTLTFTGIAAKTDSLTLPAGVTTTCTTFTVNGNSPINRVFVLSSSAFTGLATVSAGTVTVTNADFQAIAGTGAGNWNLSGGVTGNCGANTGITFTTGVPQYWSSGTGSFSTTGNWFLGSGGTGGAGRVPLPQDQAMFDANSFTAGSQTVTIDMPRIGGITCTGATNSPTIAAGLGGGGLFTRFYLDITLAAGVTLSMGANNLSYNRVIRDSVTNNNFTSNGGTITASTGNFGVVAGLGGQTLTLTDTTTFTSSGTGVISVTGGTLKAADGITVNADLVSCGSFGLLNLGLGTTWNLTGTGNIFQAAGTSRTIPGTSTVNITDRTSTLKTFAGATAYAFNMVYVYGPTEGFTITGTPTFSYLRLLDGSGVDRQLKVGNGMSRSEIRGVFN